MNISNIAALAEQLDKLGFENSGYSLLKHICFKPENFSLFKKLEKGKEQLSFYLFFEKDADKKMYFLKYYDAVLRGKFNLSSTPVNGIDINVLEKKMSEIDWKSAFDFDINKQWNVEDKSSWEEEQRIESIVEELISLEMSEVGKGTATDLKLKFWEGFSSQHLVLNINPLKTKAEVSQRFYFSEGQPGISVDEAYRFLQNRWMEKQIHAKRKLSEASSDAEGNSGESSSTGKKLLQKKQKYKSRITKGDKALLK